MSQTETILLIVLGFSLASLIALFMGRMVWTMGVKLGAKRMQRQVPSTLVGLQTERNRLRAEYAMMAQRLGSQLEAAKLKAAEQMAEVNRHRNRIRQMETSETARATELRELRAQVKALETALAKASAGEKASSGKAAGPQRSQQKPRGKAPAAGAPAPQPAAAAPPPEDPELRLRQRIEKLAELARSGNKEQQQQEPASKPFTSSASAAAEKLAEAERRTAELEEQLRKLDAEWAGKTTAATGSEAMAARDAAEDNVISLSARIHNLKKSLGSTP